MNKKYSWLMIAIAMFCPASLFAQTDSTGTFKDYPSPHGTADTSSSTTSNSDPKSMISAPPMQVHSSLRQAEGTGVSIGVYGGVIAFQDGDLHSSGGTDGDTQSRAGAVAGLRVDYTWPSIGAIGDSSPSASSANELLMPGMGIDLFYTGYRYKCNLPGPANAQFDVNSFSFMYEPKLKFNLGIWRPYVGVGVGGTYISTGSGNFATAGGAKNIDLRSDDIAFSADALAGVELFVDPQWSLSLDYKYLFILDPTFDLKSGSKFEIYGLSNSLFTAGINFYF